MRIDHRHVPPIGVPLSQDIASRNGRFRARARWTDPVSHERHSYSATFDREDDARAFLEQLRSRTRITSDPLISGRLRQRDRRSVPSRTRPIVNGERLSVQRQGPCGSDAGPLADASDQHRRDRPVGA